MVKGTAQHCRPFQIGGDQVNRVMRMGIGLVALIPVLGLAGGLFLAFGIEGEAGAWMVLGVGLAWIASMIWWALRAPEQMSDEARVRYLAFLRHAQFRPLDQAGNDKGPDRR